MTFQRVERSSPKKQPKAKAQHPLSSPDRVERYRLDQGEESLEEIKLQELTRQEMARIASRAKAQKAKAKCEETKALTGQLAEQDGDVYVEEIALAAMGQGRGGEDNAGSQVEERRTRAGWACCLGRRWRLVGAFRKLEAADACHES